MHVLTWFSYFVSAFGAINWGTTYFFKCNLVEYAANTVNIDYAKEALYGLVALSGFYALISLFLG